MSCISTFKGSLHAPTQFLWKNHKLMEMNYVMPTHLENSIIPIKMSHIFLFLSLLLPFFSRSFY